MICPLCDPKQNNPNMTEFDNAPEHLIIVCSKVGHMHVHGPFENKILIKSMARAMISEMGRHNITFDPAVQDKIGD